MDFPRNFLHFQEISRKFPLKLLQDFRIILCIFLDISCIFGYFSRIRHESLTESSDESFRNVHGFYEFFKVLDEFLNVRL